MIQLPDPVTVTYTVEPVEVLPDGTIPGLATCRCGGRFYASQNEAWGQGKCPDCRTFATDHPWYGDEASDWRCYDCDARSGSHRW